MLILMLRCAIQNAPGIVDIWNRRICVRCGSLQSFRRISCCRWHTLCTVRAYAFVCVLSSTAPNRSLSSASDILSFVFIRSRCCRPQATCICRCRWCCPHATCMCIALFHVPCFARSNPSVRTKTRPIQYDRVAHSPMYCEYTRTQREIRFSNVSLDHALCVWYLYVAVYAPMCMNNRVRIRWRDSMQIA